MKLMKKFAYAVDNSFLEDSDFMTKDIVLIGLLVGLVLLAGFMEGM